jgi:hypothetical protein
MSNLYRGPSIDASYQVSVHLAERFQRRRLKCEKLTDGKSSHCLWQGELKKNMSSDFEVGFTEYKITNIPWHFVPNGSLWTGLSSTKLYMDLSITSVHIIFCG